MTDTQTTTTDFIPTIERMGHFGASDTLAGALAIWNTGTRQVEAIDTPRPVLVREYLDNGFNPRGWYLYEAQRVTIRYRFSPRGRWAQDTMVFAKAREGKREA